MSWIDWYHSLAKPHWTPAPKTFWLQNLTLASVDIVVVWVTIV